MRFVDDLIIGGVASLLFALYGTSFPSSNRSLPGTENADRYCSTDFDIRSNNPGLVQEIFYSNLAFHRRS